MVGQTPYDLSLGSKSVSKVRLEKEGYRPEDVSVTPKDNEHANDIVKFGPLYDMGYYQDLTPNPIEVQPDSD